MKLPRVYKMRNGGSATVYEQDSVTGNLMGVRDALSKAYARCSCTWSSRGNHDLAGTGLDLIIPTTELELLRDVADAAYMLMGYGLSGPSSRNYANTLADALKALDAFREGQK